ncbi:hypothetical protein BV898_03871 [Hypsibius exemplaris]|uniref:Papilin n=1 Tax=Hypsibius exemplaris TaxID=2072580 RepID=A0A1W0X3Y0_HYPEX|nr:hypothetical protein BV898_03871 [Hypsibius exemplaris]
MASFQRVLSVPSVCVCLFSFVIVVVPAANWDGPNVNLNNDPFKNVNGFTDPFNNFKAPEPRMDLSDQRPDLVARESPNSYGGGANNQQPAFSAEGRQFPEAASLYGDGSGNSMQFGPREQQQQNPYFNSQPQNPQYGIPDMRQMPLPNLPSPNVNLPNNNLQFPNFQEPNFQLPNTANLGGPGMARDFNAGQGQFQAPFAQQPMGPVGDGQFSVPGMQGVNPLQQISQGDNQDFSSLPMGQRQAGPRPFFTEAGPSSSSSLNNNNFQQQPSQQQNSFANQNNNFNGQLQNGNNFNAQNGNNFNAQNGNNFNGQFQNENNNFNAQNGNGNLFQQQNQNTDQFQFQGQNGQQNQEQNVPQNFQQNGQQNLEQNQNQNNQNQNQEQNQNQNNQNQNQNQNQEQQSNGEGQGFNTQGMVGVGSAKVVPIEQFQQQGNMDSANNQQNGQQAVEEVTTTEAAPAAEISEPLRIPEGLRAKAAGIPDCGFHGMESWQKTPCETCRCTKGITTCEKVKCGERPDDLSCIPIFHFTTCCPTFQCAKNASRGVLPNVESPVEEGDSCEEVGKFVSTPLSKPCSACKCNDKLVIQCKPISCPPRPKDPACRERLPRNPTVCCAEFDCPRTRGVLNVTSIKPQSVALDTAEDTADGMSDLGSESSGRNSFGNSGAVLSSVDALASTEQPIVVQAVVEELTTVAEAETTSTSVKPTRLIKQAKRSTMKKATFTTTTTEEPDYTDDDSAATTSAPRPKGLNQNVKLPQIAVIPVALEVATTENVEEQTSPSTAAATTTSTLATKPTEKLTTKFQAVTATNTNSERGAIHDCQGGWKFPSGCDVSRDCAYVARWKQLPADQSVRFKITTRDADKWTGIGFSKTKSFDKVDMVVGWVDKNNRVIIQDRHGSAHQPQLDKLQTLTALRGHRSQNQTTIEFTRRQKSHDNEDIMIDDETCPYFIFPVKGGSFESFTQKIQPHVEDPEVSDVGVCITKCNDNAGASDVLTAKTTRPAVAATGNDVATAAPPTKSAAAVSGDGGSCFVEGAVISLNPCQNCTCQDGLIKCLNVNCRESFAQHMGCIPSFKVGVCCPEWQCPAGKSNQIASSSSSVTASLASGRAGQRSTLQTGSTTKASTKAQNPDKLLLLSKKQFNGSNLEGEVNSALEQIPDRMGVVPTAPANWSQSSLATSASTLAGDAEEVVATSTVVAISTVAATSTVAAPLEAVDVCLNYNCGANANCVVVGAGIPGCVCKSGFEGDATIACLRPNGKASTNFCASVKCGINARCYDIDGRPQCKCDGGFSGDPMVSCDIESHGGFVQPAECQLRSEIGGCQNFGMRWQFDSRISGCRQFVYSGCAGNDNNFESRAQCEQRCVPQKRFYRDKPCDSESELDSRACSRCECAEQGFLACTPISCGAPPNKECRVIPQASSECCPKYDCSVISGAQQNSTEVVSGSVNTKSDICSGVTCHEPAFKAGCIRVKLPGECCPTIQCGNAVINASGSAVSNATLNLAAVGARNASSVLLPGVPCSLDDKISSSNPCLSCECLNGSTTCTQVTCPPITPEQRRRCRITQLANQCCLSVECSTVTRLALSTLRPTTASPEVTASNADESANSTTQEASTKPVVLVMMSDASTALSTPITTSTTTSTTAPTTAVWTRGPRRTTQASSPITAAITAKKASTAAAVAKATAPVGRPGCSEAADGGVCRANITRWYYNAATAKCETFTYSGCGGNKNRYLTEERCKSSCSK